jgi:hypothetical protein
MEEGRSKGASKVKVDHRYYVQLENTKLKLLHPLGESSLSRAEKNRLGCIVKRGFFGGPGRFVRRFRFHDKRTSQS